MYIYTYPIPTHSIHIDVELIQNTTIDDVLKAKVSNIRCFSLCFKHWNILHIIF